MYSILRREELDPRVRRRSVQPGGLSFRTKVPVTIDKPERVEGGGHQKSEQLVAQAFEKAIPSQPLKRGQNRFVIVMANQRTA